MGLIVAFITVIGLYYLAHWLQIADFPRTRLQQQLYQSGETILPKKRHYLEWTAIEIPYFMVAHVISIMLATLLILTIIPTINLVYPLVYFAITSYAIFMLTRRPAPI